MLMESRSWLPGKGLWWPTAKGQEGSCWGDGKAVDLGRGDRYRLYMLFRFFIPFCYGTLYDIDCRTVFVYFLSFFIFLCLSFLVHCGSTNLCLF